jgi:hypothetical protein
VGFYEDDLGGFQGEPGTLTGPPLLPGTSHHYSFDEESNGTDPYCNAHVDYVVGVNLLTFHSL